MEADLRLHIENCSLLERCLYFHVHTLSSERYYVIYHNRTRLVSLEYVYLPGDDNYLQLQKLETVIHTFQFEHLGLEFQ